MSGAPSLKPVAKLEAKALPDSFWPRGWWAIVDYKIGIVPLPVFVLVLALIAGFTLTGKCRPTCRWRSCC
jgi:malate:Na+ symporter